MENETHIWEIEAPEIKHLKGKMTSHQIVTGWWWYFVERNSKAPIHSKQMVSLDVVSLSTMVPTDEILTAVQDKLASDPFLKERTYIMRDNLMEMTLLVWRQPTSGWDQIYTDKRKDKQWVHCCHQYWPTYTGNTLKEWHKNLHY